MGPPNDPVQGQGNLMPVLARLALAGPPPQWHHGRAQLYKSALPPPCSSSYRSSWYRSGLLTPCDTIAGLLTPSIGLPSCSVHLPVCTLQLIPCCPLLRRMPSGRKYLVVLCSGGLSSEGMSCPLLRRVPSWWNLRPQDGSTLSIRRVRVH